MTQAFDIALDDVLSRLQRGESLGECLARWPQYADDLRPLAETAAAGRQALAWVEPPSSAGMARARGQYMSQLDRHLAAPWWQRLWQAQPAMRAAAAVAALLIVVLALGSIVPRAEALPGDALYPVKRLVESARLLLTLDAGARAQLEGRFGRERIQEARAVLAGSRQAVLEFEGRLERIDGDLWVVEGLPVTVTPQTTIEGQPQVGSQVRVVAQALGDGTLRATRIERKGDLPGPIPTATPQPPNTPVCTETTRPADYPIDRPAGHPTDTPPPTATPNPTALPSDTPCPTSVPTSTAHPTDHPTDHPTGHPTDHPTDHPTGHPTDHPTDAPHPTDHPTDAPHPTDGPHPTDHPHPTDGPHSTSEPTSDPHHGDH